MHGERVKFENMDISFKLLSPSPSPHCTLICRVIPDVGWPSIPLANSDCFTRYTTAKCGGRQYEPGKIFVNRPEVMFLIFSTSLLTASSHAVIVSITHVHG